MENINIPQENLKVIQLLHEKMQGLMEVGDFKASDMIQTKIRKFDAELKRSVSKLTGDTKALQKVPAWQLLVGGSVEDRDGINVDLYNAITERVIVFVNELLKQ